MNLQTVENAFKQIFQDANSTLLEIIEDNLNIPKESGIAIYKNNALGAQLSSLKSIYSTCELLVGETCFKQLAFSYLRTHPMRKPDLNTFAETFPNFIQQLQQHESTLGQVPYLSDIAKLELNLNQAYYAQKHCIFDIDAFSNLSTNEQSQVTFMLNHSLHLISSCYPLKMIWDAHQAESIQAFNIEEGNYSYLIHRPEYKAEILPIPFEHYEFLFAIKNRLTLSQLCDQFPNQTNLLGSYIQNGWLGSFTL